MQARLLRWFNNLPYTDAHEHRQARMLQLVELSLLAAVGALLPMPVLSSLPPLGRVIIIGLILLVALLDGGALWLLRRGQFSRSANLLSIGLAALLCVMLYGNSLSNGAVTLFAFALPLTLGGIFGGRRGLVAVMAVCGVGVLLTLTLLQIGAPGAGFATTADNTLVLTAGSFVVIVGLLGLLLDRVRLFNDDAITVSRRRERELETLSSRLELAVRERTADLEMALTNLEVRAEEQRRLIADNARQQEIIRGLSVPILPLSHRTAVIPLVGALDSERLERLHSEALNAVERLGVHDLLLDVTGVPVIDTSVARGLLQTVGAARLIGTRVALVGVRPEVAQSIVGLGIDLSTLRSFADLETALHSIR